MQTDLISRLDFSYQDDFSLLLKSDPSYLCELTSKSHLFEEEENVLKICKILKKLNKKIVLVSDDVDLVKEIKPSGVRVSNLFNNSAGTLDDTIEYCNKMGIRIIYEYHMIMDTPLAMIPYFHKLYPELLGEIFSAEFEPQYLLQNLYPYINSLYFRNLPLCFKEKYNIKITREKDIFHYREGKIIYPDVNFYDKFCKGSSCFSCKNLAECNGTYKSIKPLLQKVYSSGKITYDNIYEDL